MPEEIDSSGIWTENRKHITFTCPNGRRCRDTSLHDETFAGGRLSKRPGETSKRLEEDSYAKLKYDATAEQDGEIIRRVAELAYLEEPYVPHALVGVMAQNTASAAKQAHVWSTGNQEIK